MYNNRFIKMSSNEQRINHNTSLTIVKDKVTGVLYTLAEMGHVTQGGVSLTPLIDVDGKPMIDKVPEPNNDIFEKFGL